MMRTLARITAFATLAFTLAACGDNSVTSPNSVSVQGTYALQTVNGQRLPYMDNSSGITLQSDVISFSSNGQFTEQAVITYLDNSNVQRSETINADGSYTKNGTAISLYYRDNTTGSGTISGNSLTLSGQNYSYVYTRQ